MFHGLNAVLSLLLAGIQMHFAIHYDRNVLPML